MGKDINAYVKKLLERVHGGFVWMDRPIPIDVELIEKIAGFPIYWVKEKKYVYDKRKEKTIEEQVKSQIGTNRGSICMVIKNINEPTTRFMTNMMAYNLLRKCHKEEAPKGVVEEVTQCAKGIVPSWAPYLLNCFLEDCRDAHDSGIDFHYPWCQPIVLG